jgi:hypothetical protein
MYGSDPLVLTMGAPPSHSIPPWVAECHFERVSSWDGMLKQNSTRESLGIFHGFSWNPFFCKSKYYRLLPYCQLFSGTDSIYDAFCTIDAMLSATSHLRVATVAGSGHKKIVVRSCCCRPRNDAAEPSGRSCTSSPMVGCQYGLPWILWSKTKSERYIYIDTHTYILYDIYI